MFLVQRNLFISAVVWVAIVRSGESQKGNVVYAELVLATDTGQVFPFGLLIRTDSNKYFIRYTNIRRDLRILQQLTKDNIVSWKVLYGRPTKVKDASAFLDNFYMTLVTNPSAGITMFRDNLYVEKHDPPITESFTENRYEAYYSVTNLKTSESCLDLNLQRDQIIKTDSWIISHMFKGELIITYNITRCPEIGSNPCKGDILVLSYRARAEQPSVAAFFPTKNDISKIEKRLAVDVVGKERTVTIPVDLGIYETLAVSFWVKGLCLQVRELLFRTWRCKEHEANLAKYDAVFAPSSGVASYHGTCVKNSEAQGVDSLKWSCSSTGVASYGKGCFCAKGYKLHKNACIAKEYNNTRNADNRRSGKVILISSLSSLVALMLVIVLFVIVWRRNRAKKGQYISKKSKLGFASFLKGTFRKEKKGRELLISNFIEGKAGKLILSEKLGEGNFASVYIATAKSILRLAKKSQFAVKILKEDAKQQDKEDFKAEIEMLKKLGHHENIVRLLGWCTEKEQTMVLEYMETGDLHSFVSTHSTEGLDWKKITKLPLENLLTFAYMIASGMKFIGDRRIVHRDLAARNILLDNNWVCKVTDFGLARDLDQDGAYFADPDREALPIKWTAFESTQKKHGYKFTTESDVWSFGVLLWELFACGEEPYGSITTSQGILKYLADGKRLEIPEKCPSDLFRVMQSCWEDEPQRRPTFSELIGMFSNLDKWRIALNDFGPCTVFNA